MMDSEHTRILVAIDTSAAHQRQMLRGIISYARQYNPHWEFLFNHRPEPLALKFKIHRRVEGVLIHESSPPVLSEPSARLLRKARVPVVLIEEMNDEFPMVLSNNAMIGQVAFDHLAGKGFENFTYYEQTGIWVFDQRRQAFEAAVGQANRHIFHPPAELVALSRSPGRVEEAMGQWLKELPKPVALFVGAIGLARQAVSACRNVGVAVPDDVAILGVGHDELDCEMVQPPLSAINQGMERAGHHAAALLDRMLQGEPAPSAAKPILIDPVGVVERQSTDIFAVENPDVREAIRWIRDHALEGEGINDLLRDLPVSRRKLEIAFRRHLGHTLHDEILRVRLDRAKYLLLQTQMALPQIAARCGFNYASRLIESFKRETGETPIKYRHRLANPPTRLR